LRKAPTNDKRRWIQLTDRFKFFLSMQGKAEVATGIPALSSWSDSYL
jgi:hypothetical protein